MMHINSFVLFRVSVMITIAYLSCSLSQLKKALKWHLSYSGSELSRLIVFYS